MRAHKVPATYLKGWKVQGYNNSFYVFYKENLEKKGLLKKYKDFRKITSEHSYFAEEDFYYLSIKKTPGLLYKLQDEIEQFLAFNKYDIKYKEFKDVSGEQSLISINNYDDFMRYRLHLNQWIISDAKRGTVDAETFECNLENELNKKIEKVIEENYFAHYLEPKWNYIRSEIEKIRTDKSIFEIEHKQDFLEFFVIQYLRIDDIIENEISASVGMVKEIFKLAGYEEGELEEYSRMDGLLDVHTYFYNMLLDAAKGNKSRIERFMKSIEESYVCDLLHSKDDIDYITTTSPCTDVTKYGNFKAEMLFPVSAKYCLRFTAKALVQGRKGQYFEQTKDDVKIINRKIVNGSKNIVISEVEYITDQI